MMYQGKLKSISTFLDLGFALELGAQLPNLKLTRLIRMFVLSRYVVTQRDQNLQIDSSASSSSTTVGLSSSALLVF